MGPEHGRLAQVETMLLGNREDVVHPRGGMDVVANGLVIPHLGEEGPEISGGHAAQRESPLHAEEDVLFWLRLPMKLHVANAVAVSLLSTAVLVLAFKDKTCPSPTPAAGIQTAPTAQGPGAANPTPPAQARPQRQRRELGKF